MWFRGVFDGAEILINLDRIIAVEAPKTRERLVFTSFVGDRRAHDIEIEYKSYSDRDEALSQVVEAIGSKMIDGRTGGWWEK